MELSKYINFRDIKNTPGFIPAPRLRRCWASPGVLETTSIAEYNKKQSISELEKIFNHIREIHYNKYIYKSLANDLSYVIKNNTVMLGTNLSIMMKKKILSYVININNTRYTCLDGIPHY
tara:strand:- start:1171 stop:1530 length:360 start_codon:yes stop_codon:yes gene_type:complete